MCIASYKTFKVSKFDKEGMVCCNYDNYAFFHSSAYKELFGERMHSRKFRIATDISGYVKLKSGKRKIYLRYHSWSTPKKDEVMLSYRNRCLLGCGSSEEYNKGAEVEIKPSNWFCYYWFNNDSGIKWPFRIAVIGLFVTVISALYPVIKDSIQLLNQYL